MEKPKIPESDEVATESLIRRLLVIDWEGHFADNSAIFRDLLDGQEIGDVPEESNVVRYYALKALRTGMMVVYKQKFNHQMQEFAECFESGNELLNFYITES